MLIRSVQKPKYNFEQIKLVFPRTPLATISNNVSRHPGTAENPVKLLSVSPEPQVDPFLAQLCSLNQTLPACCHHMQVQ